MIHEEKSKEKPPSRNGTAIKEQRPTCKSRRDKNQALRAETSKPPVATPTVTAARDAHAALATPAAKDRITPPAVHILPVSSIGVLVSEGWVVFIDLSL